MAALAKRSPIVGAKRRGRSLPPSARSLRRAGSQPRRSGRRQTLRRLSTVRCFNTQIVDSFSRDMEVQSWDTRSSRAWRKVLSSILPELSLQRAKILAVREPHLPANGPIPNQFFCVCCDHRTLATRKHELWECPGNDLINHAHMKKSDHLVQLAQECGDTDQVLFSHVFHRMRGSQVVGEQGFQ